MLKCKMEFQKQLDIIVAYAQQADKTAAEKFESAVKSAASNEMTQAQMIAVINAQFTETK